MGQGDCNNQKSGQLATKRSGLKPVIAMLFVVLAAVSARAFQEDKPADNSQADHQSQGADFQKYAPLINEISLLMGKIQQGVQVPAPRTQSRLLTMLPASTNVYFALPNYGE